MSDDMAEKARAHYSQNFPVSVVVAEPDLWMDFVPEWPSRREIIEFAASFARSAVRDALGEFAPYIQHNRTCLYDISPCTCGLSALRKKWEVGE